MSVTIAIVVSLYCVIAFAFAWNSIVEFEHPPIATGDLFRIAAVSTVWPAALCFVLVTVVMEAPRPSDASTDRQPPASPLRSVR